MLRACIQLTVAVMKLWLGREPFLEAPKYRLTAFTLTELMVVVAILGLLAAIALPSFVRAREASHRTTCQATLRQMQAAKALAAIENNWGNNVSASTMGNPLYKDTISAYLRGGVRPVCPTGPDCFYNGVSENASCTSGLEGHELQ